MQQVRFVDLGRQYAGLRKEILDAVDRISRQGSYVLGDDVDAFEERFAEYCGVSYAIGVANGSDALMLSLLALGVGHGDEVITAPNSFVASAWAIARTGARIVFADVGDDMNLDPEAVSAAVTPRTKVVMPVHLTGRVADMNAIRSIADRHALQVVEDAAQAVGARYRGGRAGSFGVSAGFSLHPLKNLHVHGDGGVITTSDTDLRDMLLKYRNHGLRSRDECAFWGLNSRLDTIQAAIVLLKMDYIDDWNARFRQIAEHYSSSLDGIVQVPVDLPHEEPVYHRYMIRTDRRDALQAFLATRGVESKVNYPIPLHLQRASESLGYKQGSFPVTERLAGTILSLPNYAELTDAEVDYVIESVCSFFSG